MAPKAIQTNAAIVSCDVCGRTLLRGEHADVFLHGGTRRTVCELCTARALHEGWIREGLDDVHAARGTAGRGARRGLLSRLRSGRRTEPRPARPRYAEERYEEELEPEFGGQRGYDPHEDAWGPADPVYEEDAAPAVAPEPAFEVGPEPDADPAVPAPAAQDPSRVQRNVHAIPTNAELKVARAIEVFNVSDQIRKVGSISRSLGAPYVTARPSVTEGSVVSIVVAWELSWYRFEVDLGDEAAGVRVVAQGSELDELEPEDRTPNAGADDAGRLHLA